ncbi:Gfo/Idh/MocA family oxidoreductase [Paenibacillus rhizoplanae]
MKLPVRKRVAMIGIGDIARKVYLPLLSRHDQAEVVGVLSHSSGTVERAVQAYRLQRGDNRAYGAAVLGSGCCVHT